MQRSCEWFINTRDLISYPQLLEIFSGEAHSVSFIKAHPNINQLCMSTPYRLASEGQYPPNNSLLLSFSTIYTPLRIFQMVKSDYACMECICSRPFAQLFDWIRPNSSVRPLIVQNTEAGGSQLRLLTSHHSRTKLLVFSEKDDWFRSALWLLTGLPLEHLQVIVFHCTF